MLLDEAAFEQARARLTDAGFGSERVHVLHGDADLARIDVTGEAHGLTGTIFRRLQAAMSDEAEQARRYAEAVREGHYVVAVSVDHDEEAKIRAADALRGAGAEFLVYYASRYIEDLGSGR